MRQLIKDEGGYALPLALSVLAIVAALSGVAIVLATHNIDRSTRDRNATRALAAADAGADAAAFRMNRALLATKIDDLLSPATVSALLAETGCLNLSAGGAEIELINGATCAPAPAEDVDSEVSDDGVGDPATFRYWVVNAANVVVGGHSLVERQIVVVGEANDVVRRIRATYRFDIEAPLSTPFQRTSYVQCTASVPASGSDPADGCPS